MKEEITVQLYIFSVLKTPEQITKIVGIPCDKSWRIGDKRGKSILTHKKNAWALCSNLSNSDSIQEQVEKLLERLSPYKNKIKKISENDNVQFSCIIHTSTSPALHFSMAIMRKICQLGASLDIDLYLIEPDAPT